MKRPLVSIILPTYNREELLKKSVRSVLASDYRNLELIIVNDGSTDRTKNVVSRINDPRVRYFEKKNKGPASARNFGLRRAKGAYISFCDDDDIFLNGKIASQVNFLEKHTEFGFCYTNGFVINKGMRRKWLSKLKQKSLRHLLLNNSQILTPSVMVRSKVFDQVGGFDEGIKLCEDYDLWLRIARDYKFGFIDRPLVEITKHGENISRDTKMLFRWGVFVKLKNLKECGELFPKSILRDYEWTLAYQQGKFYFFEDDMTSSRKFLLQALKLKYFSLRPLIFIFFTFFGQHFFDNYFIPVFKILIKNKYNRILNY